MTKISSIALGFTLLCSSAQLWASSPASSEEDPPFLRSTPLPQTTTTSTQLPQTTTAQVNPSIFDLGKDQPFPFILGTGFSGGEGSHRWTDGPQAILSVPVSTENGQVKSLTFKDTSALFTETHEQNLTVTLNGKQGNGYLYSVSTPTHTIEVLFPRNLKVDAEVVFDMPNACLVRTIDPTNPDPRLLAILFKQVEVGYYPLPLPFEATTSTLVQQPQHNSFLNRSYNFTVQTLPSNTSGTLEFSQDKADVIKLTKFTPANTTTITMRKENSTFIDHLKTEYRDRFEYSIGFGEFQIDRFIHSVLPGATFELKAFQNAPTQFGQRITWDSGNDLNHMDVRLIRDNPDLLYIEYPYGLGPRGGISASALRKIGLNMQLFTNPSTF